MDNIFIKATGIGLFRKNIKSIFSETNDESSTLFIIKANSSGLETNIGSIYMVKIALLDLLVFSAQIIPQAIPQAKVTILIDKYVKPILVIALSCNERFKAANDVFYIDKINKPVRICLFPSKY